MNQITNFRSEYPFDDDNQHKPYFLITIDTEGDNLWSKPQKITTKNAEFLSRFQSLCERYRLRPTYLTNFEMATSPVFQKFGRDIIERNKGEIGMHLHAWNTPPLIPLTENDYFFQPYLIEYPGEIMRKKILFMTDLLESTFETKMVSHRAGRWSFNERYARILIELGYKVDCSVTPNISWKQSIGDPSQWGGTDYDNFPKEPYYLDLNHIERPGYSGLLELPVTIMQKKRPIINAFTHIFGNDLIICRVLNGFFTSSFWLRPNRTNLDQLLNIIKLSILDNRMHVEFMLHSSELMPGGSPLFSAEKDIEKLYKDLECLFKFASKTCNAATLSEFYQWHSMMIDK